MTNVVPRMAEDASGEKVKVWDFICDHTSAQPAGFDDQGHVVLEELPDCPFISSAHATKKAATARGAQHAAEHDGIPRAEELRAELALSEVFEDPLDRPKELRSPEAIKADLEAHLDEVRMPEIGVFEGRIEAAK